MYCLQCGNDLAQPQTGRKPKFCSPSCRVAHHRREFRYNQMKKSVTKPSLNGTLILELFPGAGLFGKAFEKLGATVVRAPDILWGGDVRDFRGIAGRFDGVIGGPPCQVFSQAAFPSGTKAIDLIPEFLRVVDECKPTWSVMENLVSARLSENAPDWETTILRDWDCNGYTHRRRCFWFNGVPAPPAPARRLGKPEYSVLATSWKIRRFDPSRGIHPTMHSGLHYSKASVLQGYPLLGEKIAQAQPMEVAQRSRNILAVHMLGNGVPAALGDYIAEYIAYAKSGVTYPILAAAGD